MSVFHVLVKTIKRLELLKLSNNNGFDEFIKKLLKSKNSRNAE